MPINLANFVLARSFKLIFNLSKSGLAKRFDPSVLIQNYGKQVTRRDALKLIYSSFKRNPGRFNIRG